MAVEERKIPARIILQPGRVIGHWSFVPMQAHPAKQRMVGQHHSGQRPFLPQARRQQAFAAGGQVVIVRPGIVHQHQLPALILQALLER